MKPKAVSKSVGLGLYVAEREGFQINKPIAQGSLISIILLLFGKAREACLYYDSIIRWLQIW